MAESEIDKIGSSLLVGQARYREREKKERRRDERRDRLRKIATLGGKYIYDKVNARLANKTASFLNTEEVLQETVHHKNAMKNLLADTEHESKFAEFGGKVNYFSETQGKQRAEEDLKYHLSESGYSTDEAQMAHFQPWINNQSKIIGQELAKAYDERMAIGNKLKDSANYEASVKLNTRTSKTVPDLLLNRLKGLSRDELQEETLRLIKALPQTKYAKQFNALVENAYRNTGDLAWSFDTAKKSLPQALSNIDTRTEETVIIENNMVMKQIVNKEYDSSKRNPDVPTITIEVKPLLGEGTALTMADLRTPEGQEDYKKNLMDRYLKAGNPTTLALNNLTVPLQQEYFKRLKNHPSVPKGIMDTPEKILVGQEIVADLMATPNSLIDKGRSTALNNLFAMYVGAMPNFKKERLFRDVSINGVSAMEKEFSAFQVLADKLHTLPANALKDKDDDKDDDKSKALQLRTDFLKRTDVQKQLEKYTDPEQKERMAILLYENYLKDNSLPSS